MKKEYIEVGNYFIEGFLRGAFDMKDIISQIENKLINIIPKFMRDKDNKQIENEEFISVRDEIILIINRTIKVLALKAIKDECNLEDFSIEKYLDWSKIEI